MRRRVRQISTKLLSQIHPKHPKDKKTEISKPTIKITKYKFSG